MMDVTQEDKNKEWLLGHTSSKPNIQITISAMVTEKGETRFPCDYYFSQSKAQEVINSCSMNPHRWTKMSVFTLLGSLSSLNFYYLKLLFLQQWRASSAL